MRFCIPLLLIPLVLAGCPNNAAYMDEADLCFLLFQVNTGYTNAQYICRNFGGHLVQVHNMFENRAVFNYLRDAVNGANVTAFIGTTCEDGSCFMDDGTSAVYTNWAKGSNAPGLGSYIQGVFMKTADGTWDICQSCNPFFVCEFKPTS